LQFSGSFEQSFTVPHTPDHVKGWFQKISSYLQESPLIIGQEYSHFSQLTNPLSTGRHVRSFISTARFPRPELKGKSAGELGKPRASKP
jgi:hypothetical protein